MNCVIDLVNVWKSDMFDVHSIKQSCKLILENAHKKVVGGGHEKSLLVLYFSVYSIQIGDFPFIF